MLLFLALVAIVFGMVAVAVTSLVQDYLIDQRVDTQQKTTSNVAMQIAPLLAESDAGAMYDLLVGNGSELGGRFVVLNSSGIVQVDSFSLLSGRRISEREIDDILYDYADSSYGFHEIAGDAPGGSFWSLYTTASVVSNGQLIGAVLYSASIQDVVRSTDVLGLQLLWMYVFACAVVIAASVVFTGLMTKPVKQLTDVAIMISSGDLSQRAHIKGKSEMAELGATFNMMCDRLQYIDEQRSQFVSDASHELKTPLASMKILVESLLYQDGVDEAVYKDFLGDINSEIDRLSGLVTDLLLLSKMDGDIQLSQKEMLALNDVVEKCYAALLPIAEQRDISLSLDAEQPAEVVGDPLKLRQAVNNLIENAIKYTQDGGQVDIAVKKEGGEAKMIVRDNGLGIGEKHLAHIFERFYRVDKARSRETGGTGLGLHIVRRIALMHGGRVTVESKEGEGSVFTLILPAAGTKTESAGPALIEKPEGEHEEEN